MPYPWKPKSQNISKNYICTVIRFTCKALHVSFMYYYIFNGIITYLFSSCKQKLNLFKLRTYISKAFPPAMSGGYVYGELPTRSLRYSAVFYAILIWHPTQFTIHIKLYMHLLRNLTIKPRFADATFCLLRLKLVLQTFDSAHKLSSPHGQQFRGHSCRP